MPRNPDAALATLLFLGSLGVFLASPVRQIADSNLTVLLGESLIQRQSFALEPYFWDGPPVPGQTDPVNGHLYYFYPPGSSLLSAPLIAALNLWGISATTEAGKFDPDGERRIQGLLAPLLMATLTALLFRTNRLLLPRGLALGLTLASAFGTQVWSTASRALWSHTWEILLMSLAVHELLADAIGRRGLRPIRLGTLLALAYAVRPTSSPGIAGILIYVLLVRRERFARLALSSGAGLLAFVAASLGLYGHALPTFYRTLRHTGPGILLEGLLGNLISPSRGLLVYVPSLIFVGYLLLRGRGRLEQPALARLALGSALASLLPISAWPIWWGGHCYGPRLTCSLLPWLFLLAALALRAWERQELPRSRRRAEAAAGLALGLLSLAMNAPGALCVDTWRWNAEPKGIDLAPERLWDWRRAQVRAGWDWPFLEDAPVLEAGARMPAAEARARGFLGPGWSGLEGDHCWSVGFRAELRFSVLETPPARLRLQLRARSQRVRLTLNGRPLGEWRLDARSHAPQTLELTPDLLRPHNRLTLDLPDAAPAPHDPRRLGVALRALSAD